MVINSQMSCENNNKKWKANSEPRTLPANDACLDHFRIDKEQSMLADCQTLFERNEPLDKPDRHGITLLHIAAAKAYTSVVRFLLQQHVNVDQVDDTGATALHLCAKHEQGLIVKFLLDARANPTIRDRFGRKPSEVCISNGFIRSLLLKYEIKFEEKLKRAEQSDDSLEEEREQTVDSLSDIDDDEFINKDDGDDLNILFSPIPQRQQINQSPLIIDENIRIMNIFDERLTDQNSLPPKLSNDDLALLPEISEQSLLYDLEMRYRQGQIYTYIGDILIALNPFDNIPIYSRKISELYKITQTISSLSPHIYGCAERLYRNMLREKMSQCVIISGLSGSGKTESCKYIVQHILSRSLSHETALNMKINQVNPLMEAFGNAKTYINNNSSRFGKYLEIHFSPNGNVLGAHLKEYLLEKSRVTSHNSDEGNFHIFYYLFAGLSHENLLQNGLRLPSEHRYMLPNLDLVQIDPTREIEYRKKFHMVKQSLVSIGFSFDDVQSIFTILSAILHIGDIEFTPHGSNDGVRVKNNGTMDKIAELLQLSAIEFSSALVTELQVTRGEQILRERNHIQASECRDAFAKALYGRLFSWIVNGVNSYLQPMEGEDSSAHTIAVLDIFGFENFKSNSFEQLCINLTNEHMQKFLNQHIYDLEIQDCQIEGIETIDISYTDNHLVIETFLNKHSGILAILDEESRLPRATDQTLATKLHHGPGIQYQDVYSIPKDGGTTFTIRHYAAPVVYNIVGLIEKNRDFLPNSIVFVARTSNNLIIQELFRLNLNEKGVLPSSLSPSSRHPNTFHGCRDFKRTDSLNQANGKSIEKFPPVNRTLPEKTNGNTFERTGGTAMRTVAFHFKHSLIELIDKMNLCQCHFVRCIKPNELRDKSTSLTIPCVTRQLRYSGVLQMCEIRKKGYPLRIQFDEFLSRYNALVVCLLPITFDERSKDDLSFSATNSSRERAIECLKRAKIDNYKVGRTKLLFRYWHSDQLHNLAVQYETKVNVCQKVLRGWLERRKYARLREIHQLQLVFIRKFSEDIFSTGQMYKTQIDQSDQYDRKRRMKMKSIDEDDEQIEKTLNFFDSIIDPYLNDQDLNDENKMKFEQKTSTTTTNLPMKTNGNHIQQVKQEFDANHSLNTTSSTSSTSSQKNAHRPVDIHASHFHQFQNIRCRFEQMTSAATNTSSNNVRRYTSENNLNEISSSSSSSSKMHPIQKLARPPALQTIATSTEDLTNIPSWKKLSPQARLSALLDKTNHSTGLLLTANGTSASLIDLTSIDKITTNKQVQPPPSSSRPRFRFVPPSDKNSVLKEEPELEQQINQTYDNVERKALSPNQNNLVKPTVIHPTRSTLFTQPDVNHQRNHPPQNGTGAFKPLPPPPSTANTTNNNHHYQQQQQQRPIGPSLSNGNGVAYKTSQPPPVPNIKRTESVHKPGVHVGITNPNGALIRQQQQPPPQPQPQFHQSMLNLSTIGTQEQVSSPQSATGMFGSRISLQSSNFMKHPAYTPHANKTNGHHQPYVHQPPPPPHLHPHSSSGPVNRPHPPPPNVLEDPIIRWIQQVNNSSSLNGLTPNGGGNRVQSQQQTSYPYGSYISLNSGLPPTSNGSEHPHRSQNYLNQINVHKHHTPQHTVPVQSSFLSSPSASRNGQPSSTTANIYHFSHKMPSSSGGGQSRHYPQRQDVTVTTYL